MLRKKEEEFRLKEKEEIEELRSLRQKEEEHKKRQVEIKKKEEEIRLREIDEQRASDARIAEEKRIEEENTRVKEWEKKFDEDHCAIASALERSRYCLADSTSSSHPKIIATRNLHRLNNALSTTSHARS